MAYFSLAWHTPLVHLYFVSVFISGAMCDCCEKFVCPKASPPQYYKNDSFYGIVGGVEAKYSVRPTYQLELDLEAPGLDK